MPKAPEDRDEHDSFYDAIRRAVTEVDPCGILAKGEPESAYQDVITELARRLGEGEPLFPQLIATVFRRHGQDIGIDETREIARRIAKGWGFA